MTESNTHSNDQGQPEQQPEQLLGAIGGDAGNTVEKPVEEWTTGDEPMTGAQRSYLDTLAREAGETLSPELTKGEASEQIERLQGVTGRGSSQ